jgi:hypothetical protein
MVTREKAIEIARQHLADIPLPSSQYRWILAEPRQTSEGWIFDFRFECLEDPLPEDWDAMSGAPGFTVYNDGSVEDLTWHEYQSSQPS